MNRVNVVKEYEIVNAALTWIGQDPIEIPSEGTDRQKIEFLLNTYAERLKRNVSKYRYSDNAQKELKRLLLGLCENDTNAAGFAWTAVAFRVDLPDGLRRELLSELEGFPKSRRIPGLWLG